MTPNPPVHEEQTPEYKPRGCRRFVFKIILFLLTLILLLIVAIGGTTYLVYQHIVQPGIAGEPVNVNIPEGATGKSVADLLAEKGLIEHELFFRFAIRLDKSGKPLKHGPYALSKGLSATELLHILQGGPNRAYEASEIPADRKVTIPEGLSLSQMSQLFANPQAFLEAAADPVLVARAGIPSKTLEGFLMPNTYYFDTKPSEHEVVVRMASEFEAEYTKIIKELPLPTGYDKLAVITIASLVEEEAKVESERPDIAAVIYNRLKKHMPLQLDSTLQYVLHKYGERLLYTDLETDSPYNTYKHPGLPPGPISCPGASAIRAALKPTAADYLFFVSNADGQTHTFSNNETDHLKAVARFRRDIAPQRKAQEQEKGRP